MDVGGRVEFPSSAQARKGRQEGQEGSASEGGGAGLAGTQDWICPAETDPRFPLASGFASTDGGGGAPVPARQQRCARCSKCLPPAALEPSARAETHTGAPACIQVVTAAGLPGFWLSLKVTYLALAPWTLSS